MDKLCLCFLLRKMLKILFNRFGTHCQKGGVCLVCSKESIVYAYVE